MRSLNDRSVVAQSGAWGPIASPSRGRAEQRDPSSGTLPEDREAQGVVEVWALGEDRF
jgi:hypothetical protein